MIPEDFFYEGPEGSILSEGELAPVYLPLDAAQELVDRPGQVNDLVPTVGEGARERIESQLAAAVEARACAPRSRPGRTRQPWASSTRTSTTTNGSGTRWPDWCWWPPRWPRST